MVISIPHCGIEFPAELKDHYLPDKRDDLDDTDWFLQDLYNYAPNLGITVVYARYSRWVIDLNRDPESKPLYTDGRLITGLTTTTDFLGNAIYQPGFEPDPKEINRRLEMYFWPYYRHLEMLLEELKSRFGSVLLWDAHSIRHEVKSIRPTPFPDMILGSNDEKSADKTLISIALEELKKQYGVNHNDPFKGGHITRYFGKPGSGIHALQLERNKILYMDNSERQFNTERAERMRECERLMFAKMIEFLR